MKFMISDRVEFAKNPGGLPPKRAGLIIASVVGGLGLAITSVCVPFVLPALRCVMAVMGFYVLLLLKLLNYDRRVCLPFVPATTTQVANVRAALKGNQVFVFL